MTKRVRIQLVVGCAVTAVIIYFSIVTLKKLHLNVVFRSDVNWGLVVLSIIIYIYSNYIRGLAFTKGIDPDLDRMTSLEIIGLGHALNMVLPLHAGEVLRMAFFPPSYSVARRTKLMLISILADAFVVNVISIASLPFADVKDPTFMRIMWIVLFVMAAFLITLVLIVLFVPKARAYVQEYLNKSLLKMLMWVALSWIILIAAFWLGLVAFGFRFGEAIPMSFTVFVITNIINLIPASPGAIGLFESGTVIALGSFGVASETALSASLLLHVIQYLTLVPLGIFLYIMAMRGRYAAAIRSALRNKKTTETKEE